MELGWGLVRVSRASSVSYRHKFLFKATIYDKQDVFYINIVNISFLDGDVPCSKSYGVYIFQAIRFARVSSHFDTLIPVLNF